MTTSPKRSIRSVVLMITLFLLTIVTVNRVYATPQRVAVMPFTINAAQDMAYLKDGIADMLESRLAWEDKVELIPRKLSQAQLPEGRLSIEQARQIGAELGADYILFGSVTVLGDNISLDAKMTDVKGDKETHFFSHQGKGMDALIPKIDQVAAEINTKVFGRDVTPSESAAPQPSSAKQGYDIHAHPEKLIESGFGNLDRDATDTGFIRMREGRGAGSRFWKSRDLRDVITGIDLGDVDGDGKIETVVATDQQIHIYKYEKERFFNSGSIARDKHKRFIGVDVADINGNNVDEIFVTALNSQRNSVVSFVLEFKDGAFEKLSQDDHYYYRVINLPDRGDLLLGQKSTGKPFKGNVVEMVWDGSAYSTGDRIGRLRNHNIIGLAYGDVMNDGKNRMVAYNRADRIQILKQTGDSRWTSGDAYGGNMLFFAGETKGAGDIVNPQYLPMRIRIIDINGDGKNEVITARNHDIALNLFKNFRRFSKTHIESMEWDGIGLAGVWKTRRISGRVSDFTIGDFDHDGVKELVAGIVIKEGDIVLTKARSTIIAYDLIPPKQEKTE